MRLPNGFGTIYKLPGKRRRPWIARVTVGYDDNGKQLYEVVGYYEKRELALSSLTEYNSNPYDLSTANLTFTDIYERYCDNRYISKDVDIPYQYMSAYEYSSKLHTMCFKDIKTGHIQEAIDSCDKGYATKKNIKILSNLLSKYAISNDIAKTNYAELAKLPPEIKSTKHKPFSEKELKVLWKNKHCQGVKFALIYCYTGLRPTELLRIKNKNVFLDERYMLGGMKTTAGIDRVIPIAEKIYNFIEEWYNPDNEFLITTSEGLHIDKYDKLRYKFWERSEVLKKMDHLPHDGRHTCATKLDNADVPEIIIQKILGHASKSITKKTYTHKTIKQLIDAINLI